MTVLVLARDLDPTADRMVTVLGERGAEVFRVNTAWFPTQMQVSVELHDARWCGVLTTPRGSLDLGQVRAVWYRSPEAYRMPPQLSQAETQHARIEAKYGLGGVLASLPALVRDRPHHHRQRLTADPRRRTNTCGTRLPSLAGMEATKLGTLRAHHHHRHPGGVAR